MESGYNSYATGDYSTYSATGYDTDSSGTQQGTASASTSSDITDGTSSVVVNVPSVSSNPIAFSPVSGWYLKEGANSLPNGVALQVDSASGTGTATFTDQQGRNWSLSGVLDGDGHSVDITFNVSSIGQWTQQVDGRSFAPTELAALGGQSEARATMGRLHTLSTLGKVAVVAGAVAAVGGMVAGIAAVIPGGQSIALVVGAVSATIGAGAAVCAAIDYFQNEKAKT